MIYNQIAQLKDLFDTICVKIFALGRSIALIFCPANVKLALTLDYNCH